MRMIILVKKLTILTSILWLCSLTVKQRSFSLNCMDTITKGYLGQLLVEQEFLKHGFNLFKPVLENGKVDLIAEKDNKY